MKRSDPWSMPRVSVEERAFRQVVWFRLMFLY